MEAIDPSSLVSAALHGSTIGTAAPVRVVAAGKAAWPMAAAFASHAGAPLASGLVAGPRIRGEELPASFEWYDGGHPLPDRTSELAGRRALELAGESHESILVVLLSGGASAMLAAPTDDIDLDDKVRVTHGLLRAGISIDELNCVRKHLSAVKGGQLAARAAESLTLAISDVHGPVPDDPSVIGSGPTVADPTTFADGRAILQRAFPEGSPDVPATVRRRFDRGARGEVEETLKPGDGRLLRSTYRVIGNRHTAMKGAAAAARHLGYVVELMADASSGEARLAGARFAREASRVARASLSPACVIASGETTVRVRGGGHGGRNQEFALGMARVLGEAFGDPGVAAMAASVGTDGVDGPTDAAGALVTPQTLVRAARAGLDAEDALARNDTYPFFQQLGDLISWGRTGTNVGDLHVFLKW